LPQTGHPADSWEESFVGMANGGSWPGRGSAGIKLLAEYRTFSRVRERLAIQIGDYLDRRVVAGRVSRSLRQ